MGICVIKLWLDNCRDPKYFVSKNYKYEGWVWAKTYDEAIALLKTGKVCYVSLDNNLGLSSGYQVITWIIRNDMWPSEGIKCHSSDPVVCEHMNLNIARYGPYR
jgi:hypothetical protein